MSLAHPSWPWDTPLPVWWAQKNRSSISNLHELKLTLQQALKYQRSRKKGKWTPWDHDRVIMEWVMAYKNVRTFIFSPELVNALFGTDARQIDTELFKLPHEVVYFDVSSARLTVPTETGQDVCRGILAFEDFINDPGHEVPDLLVIPIFSTHEPDEKTNTWHENIALSLNSLPRDPGRNDYVIDDELAIRTVQESAEHFANIFDMTPQEILETKCGDLETSATFQQHTMILFVNCLLYVNSVNADIREGWMLNNLTEKIKKAKGKRKTKLKRMRAQGGNAYRVGYQIYIPQVAPANQGPPTGRKVNVRFMVRGHWRQVWMGSDRLGNRRQVAKWIQPFWKGPERAEVIHKMYMVKNTEENESASP
jgi:hypothetical protein